jgi:hypothetical protein
MPEGQAPRNMEFAVKSACLYNCTGMQNYVAMTLALECPVHFLGEYRTEPYKRYSSGETESKNVLGAKNSLQSWALLNLERNGA